jgi:predicted GNAT family acetyltransferase
VLERRPGDLDPVAAATAILDERFAWRIALAPQSVVSQLIAIGRFLTLVDRRQIYCRVTAAELVTELAVAHDGYSVRQAEKKDLEALIQAALHLNQSDLHVDPWCVDRDWLKRSTKSRIRKRTTFVIGPIGKPMCKLDIGSKGPAGVVIEGVYTWPELRGRGLASALVSGVAMEMLAEFPELCLHVAESNTSARRSYEKCGMVEADYCQLMLRG